MNEILLWHTGISVGTFFFKQSQETIQNNKEKYEPCIYEPPTHMEYFALCF